MSKDRQINKQFYAKWMEEAITTGSLPVKADLTEAGLSSASTVSVRVRLYERIMGQKGVMLQIYRQLKRQGDREDLKVFNKFESAYESLMEERYGMKWTADLNGTGRGKA